MHWKSLLVGGLLTYCLTSIVLKETIIAFLPRVSPLLGTVLSLIVFIWVLGAGPLLGGSSRMQPGQAQWARRPI